MVNEVILNPEGCAKLLQDVRELICEGKIRAEAAAGRELAFTYWNIGKRLLEDSLSENAGYFYSILEDLAETKPTNMYATRLRRLILSWLRPIKLTFTDATSVMSFTPPVRQTRKKCSQTATTSIKSS